MSLVKFYNFNELQGLKMKYYYIRWSISKLFGKFNRFLIPKRNEKLRIYQFLI